MVLVDRLYSLLRLLICLSIAVWRVDLHADGACAISSQCLLRRSCKCSLLILSMDLGPLMRQQGVSSLSHHAPSVEMNLFEGVLSLRKRPQGPSVSRSLRESGFLRRPSTAPRASPSAPSSLVIPLGIL